MLRLFLVTFWLGTIHKTNVLYSITGESLINSNILRLSLLQNSKDWKKLEEFSIFPRVGWRKPIDFTNYMYDQKIIIFGYQRCRHLNLFKYHWPPVSMNMLTLEVLVHIAGVLNVFGTLWRHVQKIRNNMNCNKCTLCVINNYFQHKICNK